LSDGATPLSILAGAPIGLAATHRREILLTRQLPGSVEEVWEFLTSPEQIRCWLAGRGCSLSSEAERSIGESFVRTCPSVALDRRQLQRFEPPRLLSFTWMDMMGRTDRLRRMEHLLVTVELAPHGDGVLLMLTLVPLLSAR
jgi:uncharacterized protein YndB with AHSA1/START domain